MITFRYVRWKNLLSTGNYFTEIKLNNKTNTLVVGENGSGKSTMLDALCFGLFGKAFRNVNKPNLLNSINAKDCVVEIEFDTNNWGNKLLKIFSKNPEFGILGVAGSTYMPKSGQWWEDRSKMVGVVNHEHRGKKWESKYSKNEEHEIKETVIIDGLFMSLDKNKIKKKKPVLALPNPSPSLR